MYSWTNQNKNCIYTGMTKMSDFTLFSAWCHLSIVFLCILSAILFLPMSFVCFLMIISICFWFTYCSFFSFLSIAILKYLHAKCDLADHWYPKDMKKRARVDEYLSWYHLNTRIKAAMVFRTKVYFLSYLYLLFCG